jgi:alkanesulfonate monooxygenase SsuD/methylene tetrahydromethanopterin reductase-like flavin-dependent oxidoreductase (luciferase family)
VISFGVQTWGTDVVALRHYWRVADDLGYARITYGDGLWGWTHDGWTMLGALASVTRRARLGPAVTYCFDPSSHHPSWLAKRAVTVDHLSSGRLDLRLAVGAEDATTAAAWRSHAIDYPDAPTRVALVAETIEILERLWTGEAVDYVGRFYALRGARLEPTPIQKPGPPIWLAAMGPGALGVAARRASGWEASYLTPVSFGARWERLQTLLDEAGRPWWDYRRSVELDVVLGLTDAEAAEALRRFCAARGIEADDALLGTALIGTADAVRARIAEYTAAGVTDLMLGLQIFRPASLELFAERVLASGSRNARCRPVRTRIECHMRSSHAVAACDSRRSSRIRFMEDWNDDPASSGASTPPRFRACPRACSPRQRPNPARHRWRGKS